MESRRRIFANLFVILMLGLGATLVAQVTKRHLAAHDDGVAPQLGRSPTPKEMAEAKTTIEGQLKAFKANNFIHASDFQAGGMHMQIGSPDAFRRMIMEGYPEFGNYRTVSYGNAQSSDNGEMLMVPIKLTGEDNITVMAAYLLRRENGIYKVQGVVGGGSPMPRPYGIPRLPTPGQPPTIHKSMLSNTSTGT